MSLTVIDPGFSTTIQDQGRPGFRAFGVPVGGAFDRASAMLANALLGNGSGAAVLEFTLRGGRYRANVPLALALAGAEMEATRSTPGKTSPIGPLPTSFTLEAGEELSLGWARTGARTYLAVRGGFATPATLGSRSTEQPLVAGVELPCETSRAPRRWARITELGAETPDTVRVIPGPDLLASGVSTLDLDRSFQVDPRSNRMGLRLVGPRWVWPHDPDRLSAPVCPGAVQVADGFPLILGVAGGTMGGYPHLLNVISCDLDRLGQFRPGDTFRFEWVDLATARRLDHDARIRTQVASLRIATACRDSRRSPGTTRD